MTIGTKKPTRRKLLEVAALGASAVLSGGALSGCGSQVTIGPDIPDAGQPDVVEDTTTVGRFAHDASDAPPAVDAGLTVQDAGGEL